MWRSGEWGAGAVRGALLVAGTSSDAGKSVVTAGVCRWLARQGVKVAPFKAQNMSLNSFVTPGGAEIGRAQVMQAAAAGVEPTADMNPILLKPGGDRRSQVVVLGRPAAEADAVTYRSMAGRLRDVAVASLERLRGQFDVVICEGAGSPAEINLRDTDVANMGLARAAGLPVIVVGDIDRGGVFAAMYGTLALLAPADQELVSGFVINKFRGAPELLSSGITMLGQLTGRPLLGVLPWTEGLWLDAEDSLALTSSPRLAGPAGVTTTPFGNDVLRVSVVRLPRISNFTDIDALAAEPGVLVRFASEPAELADADLVVLPGSRATVADLAWLRERGLAAVITERGRSGRPVLGVCGGYQMLAHQIEDWVESGAGEVAGLGLLPVRVEFGAEKRLGRPVGRALGAAVAGYEIHHGIVRLTADGCEPFLDGCRGGPGGAVWGTSWHGTMENDEFRRSFLAEVASLAGRDFTPAPDTDFAWLREARLDALGDLVAGHLDTAALWRLIDAGPPRGLPVLPPAGPSRPV
ncbi:MAG TPA: cobyric acid synthase [Streptosporangiaceae bacterium]|nr:cobyric acid synthase [Streptosporangiaceae bacterium]